MAQRALSSREACERAGRGHGKGCGTRAAAGHPGETLTPDGQVFPATCRVRGDVRRAAATAARLPARQGMVSVARGTWRGG